MTTLSIDKCGACHKDESSHNEPHWIMCTMCGERSAETCVTSTSVYSVSSGVWSCSECRRVMIKLRDVVDDWEKVKETMTQKSMDSASKRKMDDLEGDVRYWKRKVADKNGEVSKLQKQVRLLEGRTNVLSAAEAEIRLLKDQLYQQKQDRQRSNSGMGFHGGSSNFGDDYGMNDPMNSFGKRPAPASEAGDYYAPAPKRAASSVRILFIIDNVLRGIVMNQRLQLEFWHMNWDVCMRKGGSSQNIMSAGMAALERKSNYDHVVICGGAIDLEQMVRAGEQQKERTMNDCINNLSTLAGECVKRGIPAWVIVPPPRKNCPGWERTQLVNQLKNTLMPMQGVQPIHLEDDGGDDAMFIHTKLYDGIHIKEMYEVPMVEFILSCMGLNARISLNDTFEKEEMFGQDKCWRCGDKHRRNTTPCREFADCEQCGDRSHHRDVCLFSYKMCMSCGERGHGPGKCKSKM